MGEEKRGDVEMGSHLHITEREMESVNWIMASWRNVRVRVRGVDADGFALSS